MHLSLLQLEGKKIKIKDNNHIQRNIFKDVHKGDSFEKIYCQLNGVSSLLHQLEKQEKNSNEM